MNACATCRYWQHDRTDFVQLYEAGMRGEETWEQARERADAADRLYGFCDRVEFAPNADDRSPELALVIDGSGYSAGLYTRAEFGCVLHEDKL